MPRKDPITGCMVMTTGEFWQAEGERAGTSAAEEANKFYEEMAAEEARYDQHLHDSALSIIQEAVTWLNEVEPEDAVKQVSQIIEVLEVRSHSGFRNSSELIRARALDADGKEGVVAYARSSFSGSFYEPPDGDVNVEWEVAK